MFDFASFFQQAELLDKNLDMHAVDRTFIAANVTLTEQVEQGDEVFKDFNPDNLMVRYEFIEGLVRAAQIKYYLPRNIPRSEKKLSIALTKLVDNIKLKEDLLVYDPQVFRDELLWNKQMH